MGKATKWLKGLLGMKKDKENVDFNSNCGKEKEKKLWRFAKREKDSRGLNPVNIPATNTTWLRSYIAHTDEEQNKHAIAVAAATIVAADAAVAAAEAAIAVVRLTNQGKGALFKSGKEKWAATKIQTLFRGSLEKKIEFHSKRLSASYDPSHAAFDESPKTVEIDTYGPNNDQCFRAMPSPPPPPIPARSSIPECRQLDDFDWSFITEDYKFPTTQNTPRFTCSGRAHVPVTPAKSLCGDSPFSPHSNCPSYMANTQSFNAKLRSCSAPKQRPESVPTKRLSLNEIMAARSSFSGR